jgi:hypothetical protein
MLCPAQSRQVGAKMEAEKLGSEMVLRHDRVCGSGSTFGNSWSSEGHGRASAVLPGLCNSLEPCSGKGLTSPHPVWWPHPPCTH